MDEVTVLGTSPLGVGDPGGDDAGEENQNAGGNS